MNVLRLKGNIVCWWVVEFLEKKLCYFKLDRKLLEWCVIFQNNALLLPLLVKSNFVSNVVKSNVLLLNTGDLFVCLNRMFSWCSPAFWIWILCTVSGAMQKLRKAFWGEGFGKNLTPMLKSHVLNIEKVLHKTAYVICEWLSCSRETLFDTWEVIVHRGRCMWFLTY